MESFHPILLPPSKKTPKTMKYVCSTNLFLGSTGVADMSLREALHLPHFLQNSFCSAGIMCKVIDDGSKRQPLFSFAPNKGVYFANNRQTNILRKLSTFYVFFRDWLFATHWQSYLIYNTNRRRKSCYWRLPSEFLSCSYGTECMRLVDQRRKTCLWKSFTEVIPPDKDDIPTFQWRLSLWKMNETG